MAITVTFSSSKVPRGFTLMELLMVVAIIGILASMILVVIPNFLGGKRAKTKTIVAAVHSAMALAEAANGSISSPEEHPLAGSNTPRFSFVAASGLGGTPSTSGIALKGRPRVFHATSTVIYEMVTQKTQLCDPEDIYSDARVPMLFGLKRKYIGVLGSKQAAVTLYVNLKSVDLNKLRSDAYMTGNKGTIDNDDNDIANPNTQLEYFQVPNKTALDDMLDPSRNKQDGTLLLPLGNKVVIDQILNVSGMQGELASLGALQSAYWYEGANPYKTQEEKFVKDINDPVVNPFSKRSSSGDYMRTVTSSGRSATLPLVLFPRDEAAITPSISSSWEPGRILDAGNYKPYRLPGLAIYDAWGRELLIAYFDGRLSVISAGPDGCFRWSPRKGQSVEPTADPLTGHDNYLDGRKDNVGDTIEDN